ncbi:MAG: hypothetical protein KDD41_12040 [Flavobacteriales bacterium]|nr:hypothetical protein [Flavobacteriales bacterium]
MEAPKIPTLFGFKTRRPNQFYFEPRYYDERKEKMKQRYDRIGKELDQENASRTNPEEFRSTLRENWGDGYARRKMGGSMSKRVIIYIIALLALSYYILF